MLGQGSFGRVYLAHDTDLDRPVAIKVPISPGWSLYLDFDAYLTEARILARLSHPTSCPCTMWDVRPTGSFYVVSKYMEGGDLAAIAPGRPKTAKSGSSWPSSPRRWITRTRTTSSTATSNPRISFSTLTGAMLVRLRAGATGRGCRPGDPERGHRRIHEPRAGG